MPTRRDFFAASALGLSAFHQGLVRRYLEIMEAVPLSKILFGREALEGARMILCKNNRAVYNLE